MWVGDHGKHFSDEEVEEEWKGRTEGDKEKDG